MTRSLRRTLFEMLPWSLWAPVYAWSGVGPRRARGFRSQRVGAGSYVDPSVQIVGCNHVRIGSNTMLSEGSWLNVNHRTGPDDRITIGNHCLIGRDNFLSSGPSIVIRDFCFTGLSCRFLGCGHDIESPLVPYIVSGVTPGESIVVGVNCWLATAVTVMQGVEIGRGSIVGANTVVTKSTPPFSIVVGAPSKVTKRFDFRNNRWIDAAEWSDDLDRFMPSDAEYLDRMLSQAHRISPSLLSASSRFGHL
jgi:acetyltransferase-like isoleucine patch superfamily enzyme